MTTKWFFTGQYDEDEGVGLQHTPAGYLNIHWRCDSYRMAFPEKEIVAMRDWLNQLIGVE